MPPEIAVVVPTYRRSPLLARLIAALEAQTFPPDRFEVVIVDNGSDDDTWPVLSAAAARTVLAVRALRVEVNHGPAHARNRGWQASAAPLVAFLDDDCVPEPGWLSAAVDAFAFDPDGRVGIVQGCVRRPENSSLGDWTLFREVLGPTPYFEGCNLFARRRALEETGGFDESIGWYGEDTALGWGVLALGWNRAFAEKAIVYHDVVERGMGWHLKNHYLQGNFVGVAKRFPEFEREAFWRPWAFKRHEALFVAAVVGLVLSRWRRPTVLLVIPWFRVRRPPPGHHRWLPLLVERIAVDAASVAGMAVASIRQRRVVV